MAVSVRREITVASLLNRITSVSDRIEPMDRDLPPIPPTRIHVPPEDIADLQAVFGEILRTGQLTLGKQTAAFEAEFARMLGVRHAIAVNSGTSALEVPLRAWHLLDQEIVVPTNTFAATAFAVIHSGNRAVLADVGNDLCLSLGALEAAVTPRTKAVVLVHIGGLVARDSARIAEFCRERSILLLEDAAHAHGSTIGGRLAGTFGAAAGFSFYPTKVMTSGEGGMIVTSDPQLADTAKVLRDQGKAGFSTNLHVELGYNWRLSELHAALGLAQLRRLSGFIENRRRIAQVYDRGLRGLRHVSPVEIPQDVRSNYYKYIALLGDSVDRTPLKAKLRETLKISLAGEVYDVPLHRQPVFEKLGLGKGREFPVADDLCRRHVCLPMSAVMSEADAVRVVDGLKEAETWS